MKQTRTTKLNLVPTAIALTLVSVQLAALPQVTWGDDVTVNNRPPVGLILLDKLMSGRSRVGDTVHFETMAPVYANDNSILIPAGCPAMGTVTRSKGSGMFGKRGQLEFTCDYAVLPNGDHVPLTGQKLGGAGANGTAAVVAVTVLVSPLGLLIKGGTITLDKGTPIEMYIADGAKVTPTHHAYPKVKADFTLSEKNSADVVGTVLGFDGDSYTVKTDIGSQKLALKDITSISLEIGPTAVG
jgi:hypothetical protein